ncbi:hypothetical protein CL616_00825 [archaeon]|nr:hypothetical protein [archaeon]
MKVFDSATDVIKQGGKRRGANMGVLRIDHPNIVDFINCKADMQTMTNFNISVGATDKFMEAVLNDEEYDLVNPKTQNVDGKYRAKNIFSMIVQNAWKNGDPGIMFLDEINRKHAAKHLGDIESTNPCVTGDSLVAVADGRNYVPIKKLAEEGKDVPVYCYGNGEITTRTGRNPRLTRKKAEVYEIVLNDGSAIKATKDHKFMLRSGEYKELQNLKKGDSLMPFNKYVYTNKKRRSNYWRVCLNNGQTRGEHFLVMENVVGRPINHKTELIHHKDFDGMNNAPSNLEVMNYSKHTSIHQRGERNVMKGKWWQDLSEEGKESYRKKMSEALSGKNNPRYGVKLSKKTKSKISKTMTEKYKDPGYKEKVRLKTKESGWKISQTLKGREKVERVEICCEQCNSVKKVLPSEYTEKKKNNDLMFCSRSCVNSYYKRGFKHDSKTKARIKSKLRLISSTAEAKEKKAYAARESFKKNALRIAKHFEKTGVLFNESTWDQLKNKYPERYSYSRKIIEHFGSFDKFKQEANYNHTVAEVNFSGIEDVYNITVDEFHNLCYVTSDKKFEGTGVFETFDSTKGKVKTKVFSHKRFISGIVSKNCGEVPLLPYESCNLGSINLHRFVKPDRSDVDWDRLEKCIRNATHFLDNVIDMNKAPLKQIQDMNAKTRKIGLGIMGFADMLYEIGIAYDSDEGLAMAEKSMGFVNDISHDESMKLAEIRGSYPAWEGSDHHKEGKKMRNATCTTIAPTGTVGMIADTSGGCEPNFAISFIKNVMDGTELVYTNKVFERVAREKGFFTSELMKKVARAGTVQGFEEIPEDVKKVFVCAQDITPEWHIRMQAAFQKNTDNAISKTVNFPNNATIDDVEQVYMLAYQLNCKGVTIYRDGCRENQILNIGSVNTSKKKEMEKAYEEKKEKESLSKTDPVEEGKCPECGSKLAKEEGCSKCYACGFSACSV